MPKSAPKASPSRPPRAAQAPHKHEQGGRIWVLALMLVVIGLAAQRSGFAGVFVLDDGPAIAFNPHIKSLWPLSRSMTAPAEVTVAGRPIVSLTLALNYALAPAEVRDALTAEGTVLTPGVGGGSAAMPGTGIAP
ncbi:hypothetical protein QT636_22640, partial [Xanthomonas citri pv. citri]